MTVYFATRPFTQHLDVQCLQLIPGRSMLPNETDRPIARAVVPGLGFKRGRQGADDAKEQLVGLESLRSSPNWFN